MLAQFGLENIESILSALLYFVITIFILVTIHEFGHFIAGRIFGMHVPVFSVGMGRRIFGWNKIDGLTFGPIRPETEIQLGENTDYRLSVLPIGGYAKIDGMIDETQNEALPEEVKPWEFRAKPWWQKSIVISAGVIMNGLLAWFIFSAHDYATGEKLHTTTTVGYVENGSVSRQLGILPGDKIISIENKRVDNWEAVDRAMLENVGRDVSMTFERNGQPFSVIYRTANVSSPDDLEKAFGLSPNGFGPPKINDVVAVSPADNAGLKAGDIITEVNHDSIVNSISLIDHISSNASKPIAIAWLRGGKEMLGTVTPDATGKIGVELTPSEYTGPTKQIEYNIPQAMGAGWHDLTSSVVLTFRMLGMVIAGKTPVSKALGGPVKIAQMASQSAASGFATFAMFMALLSMSLALINILPIPALDGGHLLIILIEAAIGHELSQRFKLGFQKVGVAILLFLMVFMVINDIRGL